VFTDNPEPMLAAEATHRDHAVVEQVIAELKNGPLAHLPSGRFAEKAAWLVCAAVAHNLTRAAVLAGAYLAYLVIRMLIPAVLIFCTIRVVSTN
jgi:hypothetical protein